MEPGLPVGVECRAAEAIHGLGLLLDVRGGTVSPNILSMLTLAFKLTSSTSRPS